MFTETEKERQREREREKERKRESGVSIRRRCEKLEEQDAADYQPTVGQRLMLSHFVLDSV